MKFYWFNKKCCVPECFNSSTEGEGCYKEFFDLPAEPQSRARWLKAILSADGENLKICEDHFRDEEIFRDKNHRKKLRLNSIPSMKLPQNICSTCLGSKRPLKYSEDLEAKMCQCVPATASVLVGQTTPEKRVRITWTSEEKRTLFRAIRKHGEVRVVNNCIRINWDNVLNNCRNYGCFGNEKELKTAWQYLRTRAAKVFKNEVYGTKLERKVSRFLFGKGPKLNRLRSVPGSTRTSTSLQTDNMDVGSSEDEFSRENQKRDKNMTNDINEFPDNSQEEDECISNNSNSSIADNETQYEDKEKPSETSSSTIVAKEEVVDTEIESDDESEEEYYSIEDVRNKLGIKIAPILPEVISLISSDDSD